MKYIFITFLLSFSFLAKADGTDPIKRKSVFVEFDLSYPFYTHYNQILFEKKGHGIGGAISLGHRSFPIYAEVLYQSPMTFSYRNNEVLEQFQEIGLRYNLNHLTYVFPYGVDPYVGAGLVQRTSKFTQHSISSEGPSDILSAHSQRKMGYKLSGGVKFGNRNITLGIHYDFLPSTFVITNSESTDLTIYNTIHMFSVRAGVRLFSDNGKKIKCPRFNKRVKRTLSF